MATPIRERSYFVAPTGLYAGKVIRRVTTLLGNQRIVTSEVPIAPDVQSFRASHPNQPLTGEQFVQPAKGDEDMAKVLRELSEEELATLGLERREPEIVEPEQDEEPEPSEYPVDCGNGWWEISNGRKIRDESKARRVQAMLDQGQSGYAEEEDEDGEE